jgi:hypothetical protein
VYSEIYYVFTSISLTLFFLNSTEATQLTFISVKSASYIHTRQEPTTSDEACRSDFSSIYSLCLPPPLPLPAFEAGHEYDMSWWTGYDGSGKLPLLPCLLCNLGLRNIRRSRWAGTCNLVLVGYIVHFSCCSVASSSSAVGACSCCAVASSGGLLCFVVGSFVVVSG